MKKIMMTLAAVLCCAMISTVFTSCSKSDDETSNLYYYRAYGEVSGVNTGLGGLFVVAEYTTAIESAVGTGVTTQDDQKVINACDAVYASQKAEYGSKLSGSVQIIRIKVSDDNRTVIKEYKF